MMKKSLKMPYGHLVPQKMVLFLVDVVLCEFFICSFLHFWEMRFSRLLKWPVLIGFFIAY